MQPGRSVKSAIFAVLFIACFSPTASAQQTFVVNSVNDDIDDDTADGLCETSGGVCTLRAAIQQANATPGADQILVPVPGTYTLALPGEFEDAGATGDLDITEDVVVSGLNPSDTIVDAAGLDRIFHVLGGTVQIQSMTIRGGSAPPGESGGGVLIVNATATLSDVVVRNNQTSSFLEGGGIANDGGTVFVRRSSIIANLADCGAGLFNLGVLAVLENVTASGNIAFCTGGGLLDSGAFGQTVVTNSSFVGNTPNNIAGTQDSLHLSNTLLVPALTQENCDIIPGSGNIDDGGTSWPAPCATRCLPRRMRNWCRASRSTWRTLVAGTLPTGLSLSTLGTITGTPTVVGTSNFAVRLTDEAARTVDHATSVTVTGTGTSIAGTPPLPCGAPPTTSRSPARATARCSMS